MKRKLFIVLVVVGIIAASAVITAIAVGKDYGKSVVYYTPDPVTGEVPSAVVDEITGPGSFMEHTSEKIGAQSIKDADVIVRFKTYSDCGISLSSNSYRFDICLPSESGYSAKFADSSIYFSGRRWAEERVLSFIPANGLDDAETDTLILEIYKDGNLVDTVSISIENVMNDHGSSRREIVSCESENLIVVFYNEDTQELS